MTDDTPPCPTCDDEGEVHEYGAGYHCDICGVVFHTGNGAISVVGPRSPTEDQ